MNETTYPAIAEARQSMLRVWLALSAVWVAFWLIIAAVVLATFELHNPLIIQIGLFAIIIATPPAALLTIGAIFRWIFETVSLRRGLR